MPAARCRPGVTAEMQIPAGEMLAQKVSPAILSLAADGRIGVMTVDAQNNRVVFTPVEIARSEPDGVWVTGLPATANIITVGQGYVSAGAGRGARVRPAGHRAGRRGRTAEGR